MHSMLQYRMTWRKKKSETGILIYDKMMCLCASCVCQSDLNIYFGENSWMNVGQLKQVLLQLDLMMILLLIQGVQKCIAGFGVYQFLSDMFLFVTPCRIPSFNHIQMRNTKRYFLLGDVLNSWLENYSVKDWKMSLGW